MRRRGRVCIEVVGCQMNRLDGRILASAFAEAGWEETDAPEEADALFVFTCSVRRKPEEKVFSRLGRLRALKKRRPHLVLGVLGCMAERLGREVLRRAPHVDVVAGPGRFLEAVRLASAGPPSEPAVLAGFEEPLGYRRRPGSRSGRFQAFVSVMRGCDKYCSYCVVPYVRGPERSRPADEVVEEVRALAGEGVREVTLLGQSISAWGRDRGETLASLLRDVCAVEGLLRVRFLTSHPADFDGEVLDVFEETNRLCPHIPLPAQSGSDAVLWRMGRGYTSSDYRRLLDRLRRRVPSMEVTSDFIAGFPGETVSDHRQTLSLVRDAGFRNIFAFRYVPRPGTRAFAWADDVPAAAKQERLAELLEAQRSVGESRNRACIGRLLTVLVEGPSRRDPDRWTGRTPHNHIVTFPGPATAGETAEVRIAGATALTLLGEREPHGS